MNLKKYTEKRSFKETKEPKGSSKKFFCSSPLPIFCIQKHAASHLHYDFRLEHKGVLLSFAVPKGPSLKTSDKRLAIQVEDHPFEYRNFEGTIPKGNYGAGTVMIWDEGTYQTDENETETKKAIEAKIEAGLKKGHLVFFLNGEKLHGGYNLVKMKNTEKDWLLIKSEDQFVKDIDISKLDYSVRTQRSLDEITNGASPLTSKKSKDPKKKTKFKLPGFIKPMLATLVQRPFDGPEWIFEIKLDGYRTLAYVGDNTTLYSRNKNVFNELFKPIVDELKKLKISCIFDGEVVVLDEKGRSDFQLMQNYQKTKAGNIHYFVFDLLFLNGEDLRHLPLIERKEKLQNLLKSLSLTLISYSDHIKGKGIAFFKKAEELQLEGIIAKKTTSTYRSLRTKDWLKIKTVHRQEVVIGGFTEPRGNRKYFGALLVGVYDKKKFVYVGHVGTGFSNNLLKDLYEKMLPLTIKTCPFERHIKPNMPAVWIKPQLVIEVTFSEWTDDNIMRQPSLKGLRIDKKAKDVKREKS